MTADERLRRCEANARYISHLEDALSDIARLDKVQTLTEARDVAYLALGGRR